MNQYLKKKWKALVRKRDYTDDSTLRDCDMIFNHQIVARYSHLDRHYHNLDHIESCFKVCDELLSDRRGESITLHLAIFFHDIIYDPRKMDNEIESAKLMDTICKEIGFDSNCRAIVANSIMATMHTGSAANKTESTKYLIDIDLSILGQPAQYYDKYESKIRQEYIWVPYNTYRIGRAKVLQGFLDRERIYITDPFFNKFELQARKNLRSAIDDLKA